MTDDAGESTVRTYTKPYQFWWNALMTAAPSRPIVARWRELWRLLQLAAAQPHQRTMLDLAHPFAGDPEG
jgi:hypothetical protein